MKIGIFSKIGGMGGSERRCYVLAREMAAQGIETSIFSRKKLYQPFKDELAGKIDIFENSLDGGSSACLERFYELDSLIVVNSDSPYLSSLNYWNGTQKDMMSRGGKRKDELVNKGIKVDLSRIKQMCFLYNFGCTYAKSLPEIKQHCRDVRILCANTQYLEHLNKLLELQDFPKIFIESPISYVFADKNHSPARIRIGFHSMGDEAKMNPEFIGLVEKINSKYKNRIIWDFMGVPASKKIPLCSFSNVQIRPINSCSIPDYLNEINIYVFFPKWDRHEPWSRCVAEAIVSGCPIIALDKGGNRDQVIDGKNGFLCSTFDDFFEKLSLLITDKNALEEMSNASRNIGLNFQSGTITRKLIDFIKS